MCDRKTSSSALPATETRCNSFSPITEKKKNWSGSTICMLAILKAVRGKMPWNPQYEKGNYYYCACFCFSDQIDQEMVQLTTGIKINSILKFQQFTEANLLNNELLKHFSRVHYRTLRLGA